MKNFQFNTQQDQENYMSKLYQIKFNRKRNKFEVFENETENIISLMNKYEDALNKVKFFEKGGAFFGFTPRFFIKKV